MPRWDSFRRHFQIHLDFTSFSLSNSLRFDFTFRSFRRHAEYSFEFLLHVRNGSGLASISFSNSCQIHFDVTSYSLCLHFPIPFRSCFELGPISLANPLRRHFDYTFDLSWNPIRFSFDRFQYRFHCDSIAIHSRIHFDLSLELISS